MNIECGTDALEELESAFRFNDAVLRNLIISRKEAVTEASPLLKRGDERDDRDDRRRASEDDGDDGDDGKTRRAAADDSADSDQEGASA
jgi:small subunit ribosomal protein S6